MSRPSGRFGHGWLRAVVALVWALSMLCAPLQRAEGRAALRKPDKTVFREGLIATSIIIKFEDAVLPPAPMGGGDTWTRDDAAQPSGRRRSASDFRELSELLAEAGARRFLPLLRPNIGAKDRRPHRNATASRARLEQYYRVELPSHTQAEAAARLVDQINALRDVEIAYLAPRPIPAEAEPSGPDHTLLQGYLDPAPIGIDARYAWSLPGGRGRGVTYVDIELGWLLSHEDLSHALFVDGKPIAYADHGTAVLGEVSGKDNGWGVVGIASEARFGVASALREGRLEDYFSLAEALHSVTARLSPGDIILIELHARGPGDDTGCVCNCGQYRYVPMEYFPAEFDAIRAATEQGIVVVEAAGNGGQNLDDPMYEGAFDRRGRDSGAILVGASNPEDRTAACFSNYGSRLDVHAWGMRVATAGYGDLDNPEQPPDRKFTGHFSGTSSASPIVVGAVAAVQGIRKARRLPSLTSHEMRALLTDTGTKEAGPRRIGPLPNLRDAVARMLAPRVSSGK